MKYTARSITVKLQVTKIKDPKITGGRWGVLYRKEIIYKEMRITFLPGFSTATTEMNRKLLSSKHWGKKATDLTLLSNKLFFNNASTRSSSHEDSPHSQRTLQDKE